MKSIVFIVLLILFTNAAKSQTAEEFYLQGTIKLNSEKYEDAIIAYTKAIALNPIYAEAYCFRGRTKFKMESYQDAIKDCNIAIKLKPTFAESYYNKAISENSLGDFNNAILDFSKTLELDNKHAKAYYWKGSSLESQKDYIGAIANYTAAISNGVEVAENYYLKGKASAFNSDLTTTLIALDSAIILNRNNMYALFLRGMCYIDVKKYRGALDDFKSVAKLDTLKLLSYVQQKAYAEYNLKMLHEAIEDYTVHLVSNPTNEESYRIRGCSYIELGDYVNAVFDFDMALKFGDNNKKSTIFYLMGYAQHALKDYEHAYLSYTNAISLDPNSFLAYSNRGRLLVDIGNYSQGVLDLDKAILLNNNDFLTYYNRGVAKNAQGDIVGANSDFNKSINLNPNYADSYNNRGYMKYLLGYYNDAITDYNLALSIDPNHSLALANKAAAKYAKNQQISKALINFGNALQQFGNTINQQSASYSNVSQPASRITTTSPTEKCAYCEIKGNGKCPHCNPEGQSYACVRHPFGIECTDIDCCAKHHQCKYCDGSHICPKCNGSGNYTYNPSFYLSH